MKSEFCEAVSRALFNPARQQPAVALETMMVGAYEAKVTPHADMVLYIKFGGAWWLRSTSALT